MPDELESSHKLTENSCLKVDNVNDLVIARGKNILAVDGDCPTMLSTKECSYKGQNNIELSLHILLRHFYYIPTE